jgi:hypothetical protein
VAPRRPWVVALLAGAVAAVGAGPLLHLVQRPWHDLILMDWSALVCTGVLVGAGAHLVRRATGRAGDRAPAWALPIALFAAWAAVQRAVTLLDVICRSRRPNSRVASAV